jgi:hypothetical protein
MAGNVKLFTVVIIVASQRSRVFVTFSRSRLSIIFAGRLEPNRVEPLTAAKSFIVQAPGGWDLK